MNGIDSLFLFIAHIFALCNGMLLLDISDISLKDIFDCKKFLGFCGYELIKLRVAFGG